ncbi:winged helix DNA-binding domain-containing protein [Allorhizocola rhizosphaerae]|uniref:winged helix DNA-binding domain-containing protein n=1 Tax=Allorhizocola rhizosphaerae TaxID=1872709 RepID=UPI000E3C1728|nr:winged helix DNA-binding domain-containing protein [Allorhizocola rhizosphaerae]
MAADVLSRRELNRATLERQLLLRRWSVPVAEALERVVGMQAQAPNPPYFGLWARLEGFHQDDLIKLVQEREVVRIALMRSTIHLVTAGDCLFLRPLVQVMHERGFGSGYRKLADGLDVAAVAAAGRTLVEAKPMTFAELGEQLAQRFAGRDPHMLAMVVRTWVPLVQVPPRGLWGFSGQAAHTSAEQWLGRALRTDAGGQELILRYLAGFGPASVRDVQTWAGVTRLKEPMEQLRPRLRVFRDEQGVELFDLPEAPRPSADVTAPARFVAEFENMLLSYADRSRIISEEHRKRIFTPNGLIPGTFLLDGFVAGTWRLQRQRDESVLQVSPFGRLSKADRAALQAEGLKLLAFAAPETDHDIRFEPAAGRAA